MLFYFICCWYICCPSRYAVLCSYYPTIPSPLTEGKGEKSGLTLAKTDRKNILKFSAARTPSVSPHSAFPSPRLPYQQRKEEEKNRAPIQSKVDDRSRK